MIPLWVLVARLIVIVGGVGWCGCGVLGVLFDPRYGVVESVLNGWPVPHKEDAALLVGVLVEPDLVLVADVLIGLIELPPLWYGVE